MDSIVKEFVDYIVNKCPTGNKDNAEKAVCSSFELKKGGKDGSIYYCDHFAVRFCWSSKGPFCGTVMSLKYLSRYDDRPVFVVLVKGNGNNEIFLANSTFIVKASHSSAKLSVDKIVGSFNGSDIMKEYDDIANNAENYEKLYAIHRSFGWDDNLERIVDATAQIKGTKSKYIPDESALANIYASIERTKAFIKNGRYEILLKELDARVAARKNKIAEASEIDNVNLRGNFIETLIAADDAEIKKKNFSRKHGLGDFKMTFSDEVALTDIKTKLIDLDSNPKAYNIDKFLESMAEGNTVFFFYFVGIGEDGSMKAILASVYHKELLESYYIQQHWAGRNTRGVVQYIGKTIDEMLGKDSFRNEIDSDTARQYLKELIERQPTKPTI